MPEPDLAGLPGQLARLEDGVQPARLVQMRKIASTAAIERATTRRTRMRRFATVSSLPGFRALLGGSRVGVVTLGDAVPVIAAEAPGASSVSASQ